MRDSDINQASYELERMAGWERQMMAAPIAINRIDAEAANIWNRITGASPEAFIGDELADVIGQTRTHYQVLSDAISALPNPLQLQTVNAFQLVDQQLYDHIVAAEEARLSQQKGSGFSILMRERGFWGALLGQPGDGLIPSRKNILNQRVAHQIQTRFAGRDFGTLAPDDQRLVRELLSRLAPSAVTFNPDELAGTFNSDIELQALIDAYVNTLPAADQAAARTAMGSPDVLRQRISALVGGKEFPLEDVAAGGATSHLLPNGTAFTRDMTALLAYLRGNPTALRYLTDEHGAEVGGDVPSLEADWNAVDELYQGALKRRNAGDKRLDKAKGRTERCKAARELVQKILNAEQKRLNAERSRCRAELRYNSAATDVKEKPQLLQLMDKHQSAFDDATRESADLRRTYRSRYDDDINKGAASKRFPDVAANPPANAAGEVISGTPAVPVTEYTRDLTATQTAHLTLDGYYRKEHAKYEKDLATWTERKSQPFDDKTDPTPRGGTGHPLRDAGYTTFEELEEAHTAARKAFVEARKKSRTRAAQHKFLSPAELLMRLQGRDPELQRTARTPEDRQLRAMVSTLLMSDMVEGRIDEAATQRTAERMTREGYRPGPTIQRWKEGDTRRSFEDFVKDTLVHDTRFAKLTDLTLNTSEREIAGWLSEGDDAVLTKDTLRALIQQVELAGRDQLKGEGNLKFSTHVRPLLRRMKVVYYTAVAREAMASAGSDKGPGDILSDLLKERIDQANSSDALEFRSGSYEANQKRLADAREAEEAGDENAVARVEKWGKYAAMAATASHAWDAVKAIGKKYQDWRGKSKPTTT